MSSRSSGAFALAFASWLVVACAPTRPKIGTTETTSASALESYRGSEAAGKALAAGRYEEAASLAAHGARVDPRNGWARYDQAVALQHLGRLSAALSAYRDAEARFGLYDRQGKAVAIYGRARALDNAGRCDDATNAYIEYAAFVRPFDPRAADDALGYSTECRTRQPATADTATSDIGADLVTGRYGEALAASQRAAKSARATGWADYDRGAALAGLGRIDEAAAAYREAERRFQGRDPRARAMAVYGRARAFDLVGRCTEAKQAYQEYADLVRASTPAAADDAMTVARGCVENWAPPR